MCIRKQSLSESATLLITDSSWPQLLSVSSVLQDDSIRCQDCMKTLPRRRVPPLAEARALALPFFHSMVKNLFFGGLFSLPSYCHGKTP